MMILNVNIHFILLVCFVYSVVCYPKQDKSKDSRIYKTGNKTLLRERTRGHIDFEKSPENIDLNLDEHYLSHTLSQKNEDIEGKIIMNDGNIEGEMKLPSNLDGTKTAKNRPQKKGQNTGTNDGGITGEIEVDDQGNIDGQIDIDEDMQSKGVIAGNGNDGGKIEGNIDIDDDGNINGNIDINDDGNINDNVNIGDDGKIGGGVDTGGITGEIDIDDEGNIKGNIAIDDGEKNKDGVETGGITGEIDIDDDGNINGNIDIDDGGKVGGSVDTGGITGEIDIDDKGNINGNIDIDDGVVKTGGSVDTGGITGEIDIDDKGNVNGNIDIDDGGKTGGGVDTGGITGEIDIDDKGNINGNIDIDDGKMKSGGGVDTGGITGEVDIDDKGNIDGHIDIDDEENIKEVVGNDNDLDRLNNDNNEKNQGKSDGINGEVIIDEEGNIGGEIDIDDGVKLDSKFKSNDKTSNNDGKNCWMNTDTKIYTKRQALADLDAKFQKARKQYQDEVGPDFDQQMIDTLLSSQGKAPRAIHQARGNPNIIPAGLNLGGFGLMRMPGSMLFFHRMKLRNSTEFRVNFLHADLMTMTLVARLDLNDLHLRGAYERATTEEHHSVMYFQPTYGELDLLINAADYKLEGRLRMLNNRLMIELINSQIQMKDILLTYGNLTTSSKSVDITSTEDFISRLKCDLDLWLKDYFNDYLMYFGIIGAGKNSEILTYEKQKTIHANEFADTAIKDIKRRLRQLKASNVKLPSFTLLSVVDHRIELKKGILRGLDSLYRRSVAMTKEEHSIRTFDMTVGFSNLKVEYTYEAQIFRGSPALTGVLVLSADDLAAHLELQIAGDASGVQIKIDSIEQLKSESLTVEGPANRLIADFKYLLENPIISLMTNIIKHNVKMLNTITRCEPNLWGEDAEQAEYNYTSKIDKKPGNKDDDFKNYSDDQDDTDDSKPNKYWSDYIFSKNDSVEIEVPFNNDTQKMKLSRQEHFVLKNIN